MPSECNIVGIVLTLDDGSPAPDFIEVSQNGDLSASTANIFYEGTYKLKASYYIEGGENFETPRFQLDVIFLPLASLEDSKEEELLVA